MSTHHMRYRFDQEEETTFPRLRGNSCGTRGTRDFTGADKAAAERERRREPVSLGRGKNGPRR